MIKRYSFTLLRVWGCFWGVGSTTVLQILSISSHWHVITEMTKFSHWTQHHSHFLFQSCSLSFSEWESSRVILQVVQNLLRLVYHFLTQHNYSTNSRLNILKEEPRLMHTLVAHISTAPSPSTPWKQVSHRGKNSGRKLSFKCSVSTKILLMCRQETIVVCSNLHSQKIYFFSFKDAMIFVRSVIKVS